MSDAGRMEPGYDENMIASELIEAFALGQAKGDIDSERAIELVAKALLKAETPSAVVIALAYEAGLYVRLLAKERGKDLEQLLAENRDVSTLARLDVELEEDDD